MHNSVRRGLLAAAFSGGFLLFGTAMASADTVGNGLLGDVVNSVVNGGNGGNSGDGGNATSSNNATSG
ncbi:hypothetical protein SK571_46070, partial [Lentzea sp. BCCO 10_0798]